MFKKIAATLAATAIAATLTAGIATARPVYDQTAGSADRSTCNTVKVTDRGFLIQVRFLEVDEQGRKSTGWRNQRIANQAELDALTPGTYRIIRDRGIENRNLCEYRRASN